MDSFRTSRDEVARNGPVAPWSTLGGQITRGEKVRCHERAGTPRRLRAELRKPAVREPKNTPPDDLAGLLCHVAWEWFPDRGNCPKRMRDNVQLLSPVASGLARDGRHYL